jgi:hypothetical protein
MERKTFDIARPSRVNPSATSRPVIVGHQPMMRDPMVNQRTAPQSQAESVPTPIAVHTTKVIEVSPEVRQDLEVNQAIASAPAPQSQAPAEEQPIAEVAATPMTQETAAPAAGLAAESPANQPAPAAAAPATLPEVDLSNLPHIPVSHMPTTSSGKVKRLFIWLLVAVFLIAFAGYLAIDAGLVKSSVNLPFHIFRQQS